MLNRRHLLLAAGSAALAGSATAQSAAPGAGLTALLDQVMQDALRNSPQLTTIAGMDSGPGAGAKSRLDDRSAAGLNQMKTLMQRLQAGLGRFRPETLTGMDLLNYRVGEDLAKTTLRSFDFPYGDPGVGGAVPYVVTQMTGSYQSIPGFLSSQHSIVTADDAEAYLSRLAAFARVLDQETERVRGDLAEGASPPDFILRRTERQLRGMLTGAPAASELVGNLTRRTTAKAVPGDWTGRAAKIVADQVRPALARQADLLAAALPGATSDAGCWRLPEGEAYYRYAVRSFTTTDMPGEEIHRLGLALVASLTARAKTILKARGLTQGSVAQRIAALRKDPAHLYPNTDAGRARVLADIDRMIADMRGRLPQWFAALPQAPVTVQRTPVSIEAGAPGGVYQPPSVDGARPGLLSMNLRDTAEWPRFDVPTFVYHEVLPGHHLQNALAMEAKGLPLMRRMPLFSGYSEGWALYAEQLADEMGVYDGDDLGRLGYLASLLFRAARLVVDSGLHHRRWTREQAIRYMVETLGDAETTVTREVERYCVQPGQASGYMLGHQVWTRSRDKAKARLGARFDIRAFHDAGLLTGTLPLSVLEAHLDAWTGG